MNRKLAFVSSGIVLLLAIAFSLQADQVDMRNGDRYFGSVLSVSASTVVLQSETLGKVSLPRRSVAHLIFATNDLVAADSAKVVQDQASTNLTNAVLTTTSTNTETDLSAALRNLVADTNLIQQVGRQMLASSPEATARYNELVHGLLTGKLDMKDLRREAKSSADQLRSLQKELGSDASDTLDGYLQVLDYFLAETAPSPTNSSPARPKP